MTSTLDRMEIIAYFDAGFAHSAKIPFYAWQYRAPTPRSKRVSSTAAFDIPGTAEIGVRYAVRDPKSGELAERSLRFSLGQVSTGVYALVADADASIRADFASLALGDEAGTLKYRGGMPLDRDYVTIEFRPAFD